MQTRSRWGRPTEVYIDTNGFSDLFRGDSLGERALRIELRESARIGRFRYLTTGWTIEELAGLVRHDLPKYRRIARFVFELIRDGMIDDAPTLLEREIRLGRPLRGNERLVPRAQLVELRRNWGNADVARQITDETKRENLAAKAELQETRDTAWGALAEASKNDPRAGGDPKVAALLWHKESATWTDEWTRDFLSRRLGDAGLDANTAARYAVHNFPSARNGTAAMIARIGWNVGHGRRIDEGDNIDTRHYIAACYTDVFVSGDRDLREIVDLIPSAPVRPLSMSDFARTILRQLPAKR